MNPAGFWTFLSVLFHMFRTEYRRWLWWRLALPPLLHLFGDAMGFIFYRDIVAAHYTGPLWFWMYLKEYLIITAGLYFVSEGNVRTYIRLEKKLSWEAQPQKRLWTQLAFAFVWMVLAGGLLSIALQIFGFEELSRDSAVNMTLMSMLVTVSVVIIFFIHKLKSTWLEGERLKRETMVAQDLALRQQTDPHFLFNSLNTLTSLIMQDPVLASQYVGRLSRVYRYVLQSKDRSVVPLREELEFVKDFAFGFTLRYGDHFRLSLHIEHEYDETPIPPLTLQILLENCIKHNIVSKDKPLFVDMRVEGKKYLVVENNLQRKEPESTPTRIGLSNIISRYSLLTPEIIQITETERMFSVRLPLLAAL